MNLICNRKNFFRFSLFKKRHYGVYNSRTQLYPDEERTDAMIWKEKYKIGVAQIDEQHEELFARVTDFVETVCSHMEWTLKADNINKTLDFMKDYVIIHFQSEEAYQAKIGYPDLERHRKIHDDMVAYVNKISEDHDEIGYREIVIQQFAGKLVTWLVNHVLEEDQKISDFAAKRGV
jgi:hemerythrin